MKIAEISEENLIEYLKIEPENLDRFILSTAAEGAKDYIKNMTGLSEEEIYEHDDLSIAYLLLTQNAYDNRSIYGTEKVVSNPVVDDILGAYGKGCLI